jgi:hypothetical protein
MFRHRGGGWDKRGDNTVTFKPGRLSIAVSIA